MCLPIGNEVVLNNSKTTGSILWKITTFQYPHDAAILDLILAYSENAPLSQSE